MKVILKETISSLGIIGSEVNVKNGYARNYLLPQQKAVLATPQNRRLIEKEKGKFDIQIAKERETAEVMASSLKDVVCKISGKITDEDRLYGSVTARDIIKALATQDIEVEKRMVLLKEPIKALGAYKVPIRIYADVEPEITVEIVPE
ncbi:MAG: 50S ribosomal protein L9 [Deltaproteobacteria bacterium]|nr:50S ribosomal protein L9 [Deltaproteobacteria bacterium]MBW1814375.1 50S ribosomal protein L9 [Deltaproteobacteria bacterium]MBW1846487.1 50S ribosomal protein L9 [Deltaproteobacteria bacterium]MBW1984483.1 50S ribosomal protein L9 [Deltaproteobacteria bacterium]MBW2180206.1 50S ribosomal protein L9 [Deltaproteobacteria bacterium]